MLDTHARRYVQPIIGCGADLFLMARFSANQVTVLAFVFGLGAGLMVFLGQPFAAFALLWLSGYFDAVDGSMARKVGKTTGWGTLLDIVFDRFVELSVIIALAVRFPQHQLVLLLLTASIVLSMTVFLTVGALSEKKGMKSFYYQAGLCERSEGFIIFSLMILFPQYLSWSTLVFVGSVLFTAGQRIREAKRVLR